MLSAWGTQSRRELKTFRYDVICARARRASSSPTSSQQAFCEFLIPCFSSNVESSRGMPSGRRIELSIQMLVMGNVFVLFIFTRHKITFLM